MNETSVNDVYDALSQPSRLLLEADLKPLQGHRFQPTGFPDLGPALYTAPDGKKMLLVESPQSVANRMEMACWDSARQDLIAGLDGLPYVRILDDSGRSVSNSLLDAHRINSEYIMKKSVRIIRDNGTPKPTNLTFNEEFSAEIGYQKDGQVDWKRFRDALLRYDANSLIHGCFLEEIGGRLRVTRALSGFVEASGVGVAESGGVKNNIVQPDLKGGEGNVPYHRTEFTAERIVAYFNLDLALLRSYGLPAEVEKLLITLALFKIRRFLSAGLRLRTACDLELSGEGLRVTRPQGLAMPSEESLLAECTRLLQIDACKQLFADPAVTEIQWTK